MSSIILKFYCFDVTIARLISTTTNVSREFKKLTRACFMESRLLNNNTICRAHNNIRLCSELFGSLVSALITAQPRYQASR